jgi:hypothetical protein
MHLALFFWGRLPVPDYGGTQRMAVCLARGLAEAGHRVSLIAAPGSVVPGAELVPVDPALARRPTFSIEPHLPPGMDLLLSFVELRRPPHAPWIHRLAGNRLELEVTEGVFLGDNGSTLDVLKRLRALGVRLDLDDFGTGYSSIG